MAFRKVIPQGISNSIQEDVHKILTDYASAWKGSESCPFQYVKDEHGQLIVRHNDGSEYILLMGVTSNG